MKTIEEKAKAYDKVREKIAVRFGTNVAEEIFSEFEESKDEKIRKGLIKGFNECLKNSQYSNNAQKYWHNIKIEDIFAWLEKQPIIREKDKWLIDETLYFLDEFQQSDRCYSENEMQNSITCKNWLKSLK